MHPWRLLFFFMVISLLLACKPSDNAKIDTLPTLTQVTSTCTLVHSTKRALPTKTPTSTSTDVAPTAIVSVTPEPDWRLCSPLAEQTIQEIPEIVSDPYNPPPLGKDDRHHGTDLAYYRRKERTTIEGEVVQAILPGKIVAVVENQLPYGNMVIIETNRAELPSELIAELEIAPDESLYHLYAHFRTSPLVEIREWVECGQALGEVGATGYNIVNAHLHLETRLGPSSADYSDGMAYYDTRTTEQERANYELWRTSGEFHHFDPMRLIDIYLESWGDK